MAAGARDVAERWLRECGCARLEKAAGEALSAGARKGVETFARNAQRRWGCTVAGHTHLPVLPPDRRGLADSYARAMRCEAGGACPFEAAYAADGFALELFDGLALTEASMTWLDALGREPTAADRDGVLIILKARRAIKALVMEKFERERSKREQGGEE